MQLATCILLFFHHFLSECKIGHWLHWPGKFYKHNFNQVTFFTVISSVQWQACITWGTLSKKKKPTQTPLSKIIMHIPQNTVNSFKGCTCFVFTKRRLCTCTLPGIITNTFTHTQLTSLLMHRLVSFPTL